MKASRYTALSNAWKYRLDKRLTENTHLERENNRLEKICAELETLKSLMPRDLIEYTGVTVYTIQMLKNKLSFKRYQ